MAGFDLGSVVLHLESNLTDFKKGLNQAQDEVNLFGNRIQSVADKVQLFSGVAATAGIAAVGLFTKNAIQDAETYEQQVIALTTLLGDQAAAEKQIAIVRKDALKTPFNVEGLIKYNQLLISAGVNADQSEKDILNLGDAISANGKGANEMDRIVVNLQQIKNVGKATEMDMRQFAFNGINMYQLLADSTKLPISQLKDMDITYEMVSGALAKASAEGGKYHDANLKQSASLQGLKSNLQDTIQQQGTSIVMNTGLFEAIKNVTGALTKWITDVAPKVTVAIMEFEVAILDLTIFLRDHKDQVALVASILITFFVPALIAVAVQMGINTVTAVANATWSIIQFAIEGWKAIGMLVAKTIQLGIATISIIAHSAATVWATIVTTAMTAATWLLNVALLVLTSPIFLVVAAIVALIAIGWLLIANWDKVKAFGQQMLDSLVSGFWGFVSILKNIGGHILNAIKKPFEDAWHYVEGVMNKIKSALDFTKRHSPSTLDIVQKGVKLVNNALGDLAAPINMPSHAMAPSAMSSGSMTNVGNITIDLSGAIISDQFAAQRIGEKIGDSIIGRLKANVRF